MLILFMRVGGLVVSNINSKRATALCIITEGKKNFNMKSPIKLEFCFVLLVSFAVTTPAHNETGSGIDCFGERTVLTNCKDEERVRLFYFNKDNNSCQDYMGCPLEENETTLNVFSNRESCKENCPATECSYPSQIANGYLNISDSENDTRTAYYTCMNSYELIGPSERKCLYNGSWTGREPTCKLLKAIECSYPSQIANGFYYISRSKDGTKTAHYACLNSYKLIGPTERKCLFNGSWTGKEPTCELAEVTTCDDSPDVLGATKHYLCHGKQTPQCLILYTCNDDEGYELLSGVGFRRCGSDGKWINDLPICARLRVMQGKNEVSDEIKATDGQTNFEVQCVIEPVRPPTASIKWNNFGENGKTVWKDEKSLALNFGKVNFKDAGSYKCSMQMDKIIEKSVQFVVVAPDKVAVSLIFHYGQITPDIISLTCIYRAREKPTVRWYFNDELFEPNKTRGQFQTDKTFYHPEINFNVLEIVKPTSANNGAYACEANNDNSTQEWFHVNLPGNSPTPRARRSPDRTTGKGTAYTKEDVVSTSSICADKSSVAFIGRVKREVKQNNVPNFYILHVEKILSSSSSDLSGFPSPASESTLLTHVPNAGFFPMKYSLRDLYIFVVRTDSNGKWVISDSYPYSKNLETVLENVCS